MALIDSLVSWWALDEASGNALDSHGGNNLTETSGTIASAAGKVGNARDFEATVDTEYFELADNAALSMGDIDFTIAFWVNFESLGAQDIVSKSTGSAPNQEYIVGYSGTRIRFLTYAAADGSSVTALNANTFGAASTGTWYFVACWHNATANTISICVNDGTVDSTATSAGVRDGTAPFRLGARGNDTTYFDGLLDEVAIWKRVLTSAEITELYNAGNGRSYAYVSGGTKSPPVYRRRTRFFTGR